MASVPVSLSPPLSLKLSFLWLRTHCPLFLQLPVALARKVAKLLENSYVLHSLSSSLLIYDIPNRTCADVRLPFDLHGASFCFITKHHIICVGQWPRSGDALIFDLSTLQTTACPALKFGRSYSKLIKIWKFVYAFGGLIGEARSVSNCERLLPGRKEWEVLPSIPHRPRFAYSACKYRKDVYIALPDCGFVEVFSTASQDFGSVPMPKLGGNSVSVVVGGELLIVSASGEALKWEIGESPDFCLFGVSNREISSSVSEFEIVVANRKLYWIRGEVFVSDCDLQEFQPVQITHVEQKFLIL